ncbi:cation transporter [Sphingomonas alpina]|uniref:Cation transporter n=1 Tax=Sphingomonas alpina TaxID=653931 RepID=A0A7H0LME0_9SPHN|nr:cation transporter [Sphingomonas alpina]
MSAHAPKLTLYTALAANAGIAVAKLSGAAYTGSSAMVSEGIHSLVDTVNQLLLLYGLRDANSLGRRSPR